jgi:hypothetical protein
MPAKNMIKFSLLNAGETPESPRDQHVREIPMVTERNTQNSPRFNKQEETDEIILDYSNKRTQIVPTNGH